MHQVCGNWGESACYAGLKVGHIAKNLDISLSDVNGCLNILLHIENH